MKSSERGIEAEQRRGGKIKGKDWKCRTEGKEIGMRDEQQGWEEGKEEEEGGGGKKGSRR